MSFPREKKGYFKLHIELVLNMLRLSKLFGENIFQAFYLCNAMRQVL
jgi:hypothetical protein